jgi:DNA-binding HxlR family transcriptional regulator
MLSDVLIVLRFQGDRAIGRVSRNGMFWPEITCFLQAGSILSNVRGKSKPKRRSGCPVSIALELLGDRWSLLIVRDLMVRGYRTFKEFQESGEGIATNILADRLQKLQMAGIITSETRHTDGRRVNYALTEKGIDLAPVLLELLIWAARHEQTAAPCGVIADMEQRRTEVLAEVRKRWREGDSAPVLPRFEAESRDNDASATRERGAEEPESARESTRKIRNRSRG